MTNTRRDRRVAFVVPHRRGCQDMLTGDVFESIEQLRETVDHVEFRIAEC
jgi:hypothetical protein